MRPLVSILIPAYNAERWIADTICSALAQTWPNKEIIVVDDGSTDRTFSVARQFTSASVNVVTQENQGAPAARNKAFSLCQGEYIQWLDADDLLSPTKIEAQILAAEQHGSKRTLFSCGWVAFRRRVTSANPISTSLWCDLSPFEWMLRKWEGNLHMQTATWLVSRELTAVAGPWDTRLMGDDDGEYFCRVILASDGIKFVPNEYVFYRITGSNRWSYIGRSDKKLEAHFLSMKMQIGYLRSIEDTPRVRQACLNYLQTWFFYFYPERMDLVEQFHELATALGGQLKVPQVSWKYRWIQETFGLAAAKRCQLCYNVVKSDFLQAWDALLFHLENLSVSGAVRVSRSLQKSR